MNRVFCAALIVTGLVVVAGAAFARPAGTALSGPSAARGDAWAAPQNISQSGTSFEYSQYAHCGGVAADTAGNLHATWYAPTATVTKVCYRRRDRATGAWGTVETVSTSTSLNSYRGGVAADYSGNVHAVWMRSTAPNSGIWYSRRDAATGTWTAESRIATKYASGTPGEPAIAARPGGNEVHVVWTQRCSTGVAPTYAKVWHREFNGTAWGPITMVSLDTATQATTAGVAVDSANNVHVAWSQYGNASSEYKIWYRARIGGTWGAIEKVSTPDLDATSQYNPDIEVGPNGTPHVAWHGRTPQAPTYFRILYRNRAGGAWGQIDTFSVYNNAHNRFPALALAGDTVHVAWRRDSTGSSTYSHLRYRRCILPGAWEDDTRLTPGNWTSFAYYAAIAADRSDVHLVWYDTWNGTSAAYTDVWYLRRPAVPDLDYAAVSVDSVWPFQPRGGSTRVGATVRNAGRLNQPAGKLVRLEIAGPGGYVYRDSALTEAGLVPGQSTAVVFPSDWAVPDTRGFYTLAAISDLDGDGDPANDTCRFGVEVYPGLYETFSGTAFPPEGWRIYNFDNSDPWARHTAYSYTAPACARVYFDTPNNDWLITPRLGPVDAGDDSVAFYFRADQGNYHETLTVKLSTSSQTDTATFSAVVGRFVTTGTTAWRRLAFSLAAWRDSAVYLAFVYKNHDAFGVAVDDVMGPKVAAPPLDAAVTSARIATYPVAVGAGETCAAVVRNRGTQATGPFRVRLLVDGAVLDSAAVTGLAPGDSAALEFTFNLSAVTRAGFRVACDLPGDEVPLNDTFAFDDWVFPRNTWAAQGFDRPHAAVFPPPGWVRRNADGGLQQWQWREESGFEHSGRRHAGVRWESPTLRNDDWLISPALTPTATGNDTVGFFWRAYNSGWRESLEVYAMAGQSGPADTIARLFAGGTASEAWLEQKLSLDAWDEQPIYIGFRYPALDAWWVLLDDVWWQTTRGGPAAPLLAAPPDGADSQPYSGRLAWHPAFNADVYDVWLDTVSPPARLVAEALADTAVEYSGLLPWRRYWWRVDARNRAGRAVSVVWSFSTFGPDTSAPGWAEVGQVPLAPSGRPPKDGAALAFDRGSGAFFVLKGNKAGDFYRFLPRTGEWAELEPMPAGAENKLPGKGAAICADGNGTVYATKGNNTAGFWRYGRDSSAQRWTALADVPLGASNKKVKGGTGLAYVDAGDSQYVYLLKGYKTEFYRYNVGSGAWQALADAPAGVRARYDRGSWLALDADAGRLYAHKAKVHEFHAYDLAAGAWGGALAAMPLENSQTGKRKKAKDGSGGAALGGLVYALKGGNTQDFYAFDPLNGAWRELDTMPSFGSTAKRKRVKAGGAVAADNLHVYALKGNKTAELWRYVPGAPVAGSGARPARTALQGAGREQSVAQVFFQSPARGRAVVIRLSGLPAGEPALLSIHDAAGRLVFRRAAGTRQASFNVALAAGVYLVRLSSGRGETVRKLVVER